jgi:hypothetical protein
MNFLSLFSTKSLIIHPEAINNPEAVRLSYPIQIETKDNVGLNNIKIKTKYVYFLSLVRVSCEAKKYAANEKTADCVMESVVKTQLLPSIDKNNITSGYPAGK